MPKAEGVAVSHGEKALPLERLWELMVGIKADKDDRRWDGLPERPISSYLLEFFVVTGVRISEVCDAKWRDIKEADGKWDVPETKTELARAVPITSTMAQVLKDVREILKAHGLPTEGDYPVFPRIEKEKTDGKPYSRQAILTRVKKICRKNDLPKETNLHGKRTNLRGWGKRMKKYPRLRAISGPYRDTVSAQSRRQSRASV